MQVVVRGDLARRAVRRSATGLPSRSLGGGWSLGRSGNEPAGSGRRFGGVLGRRSAGMMPARRQ